MQTTGKYTLSIAGFDPSAGAGLLADIKTFEQCGVYGLSVCTAVTFQNDIEFNGLEWISTKSILSQLDILLKRFAIGVVKIGLVKNLDTLVEIVLALKQKNKAIRIIWDPILKSSTNFTFHTALNKELLLGILPQLYLVTPNREEIVKMNDNDNAEEIAFQLSKYCAVLLKGGHQYTSSNANDILFMNESSEVITGERIIGKTKHGTGCVLSSAIASFLTHGFSLSESCNKAKGYVHSFINSSDDLLGLHRSIIQAGTHA